jgi:dolichol-phosphate mannosyltransferase
VLLSVVLPCYNESGCVERFAAELFPALDALQVPYEVIAVDDGSSDGTGEALRTLAGARPGFKAAAHDRNRGMGAALRTGFAAASGDWIVTMDADLTFHPSQIKALLDIQHRTGADLVAGSPFLTPQGAAQISWLRRLPSILVNAYYRGACGPQLTAYTPIFRLYRADALRALQLTSTGFEINAEIAARFLAAGQTVAEVPVVLTARLRGRSKLSPLRELWRHARLGLRLLREAPPP